MKGRQPPLGESLTARQKRVFVAVGVIFVILAAGVSVWSATHKDSYGRSAHGCVNVTVASTTGGAILHDCGAAAQTLCRNAFFHHDHTSLLARPQCRLAGLGPGGR